MFIIKREVDILQGSVFKNLFLFTIPIALTGMLQLLYNAADIAVVGRFAGSSSLAAVGATTSLINLLINFFMGISIGTNVCVAQYTGVGKSENDKINKTVHTSILIAVIGGTFLATCGIIFAKNILNAMGTPSDIIDEATLYIRIIFMGIPALVTYNFCAAILRAVGDAKTPFVVLALSGILNVILNLFFVICFHMGAEGVGIATIISQYLSVVLALIALIRIKGPCKFSFKDLKIDKFIAKKILKIGIPASVQGLIFSISNLQVQSSVNTFGASAVAGNSAACTIESFVYTAGNSIYQALITFIGQNAGAGDYDRVKKIAKAGYLEVLMISSTVTLIFLLSARTLLNIYTPGDMKVINFGMERIKYVMAFQFLCALMEASVGILRGLGVSLLPMIVSIVGVCGVRMGWLLTVFPIVKTIRCVYVSYPISWLFTGILHFIFMIFVYKKKRREREERALKS